MSLMKLNVGGVTHQVMADTLENVPESRLGKLARAVNEEEIRGLCNSYVKESNEYFFDRSFRSFDNILNLYRTGKLHMNEDLCVSTFIEDLNYWGIDAALLDTCCEKKFEERKVFLNYELEMENETSGTYSSKVWSFLDDPRSSIGARIFSCFSLAIVILSLVIGTLKTFPSLSSVDIDGELEDNPKLVWAEAVIMAVWVVELIFRFIASPNMCKFIQGGVNIVDFLTIFAYLVSVILAVILTNWTFKSPRTIDTALAGGPRSTAEPDEDDGGQLILVSWLSPKWYRLVSSIFRILKLGRYSAGVRIFAFSLWKSGMELLLVLCLLFIGSLLFGSVQYSLEMDEPDTSFYHLGNSYYWAIITMTTVGYGDMYPSTGLGKIVAALCVIFGILCLALPIPLIITNFTKLYRDQIKAEKNRYANNVAGGGSIFGRNN